MNGRSVVTAIAMGELDEHLDNIIEAGRAREKIAHRNKAAALKPGDRVRLTGIRPKGIDGATGTVQSRRQTSLMIVIDKEYAPVAGRFGPQISMGLALGVPAACIGEVLSGS